MTQVIPGGAVFRLDVKRPAWVQPVSLASGTFFLLCALALAVFIPAYQQLEILIVTFWFALLGALLLNTAGMYVVTGRRRIGRLVTGLLLGLLGMAWPLVRQGEGPDQRFYWMIALGPLAISGCLMLRAQLAPTHVAPSIAKGARPPQSRGPVKRVPNSPAYRWALPVALGMMLLAVGVVLVTVVVPAVLLLLR